MGTRENVHLPTSSLVLRLTRSSVLLHMIRSAPHLMSRNVPRQVMVSRSVVKFPKRIATKFRGRRVPRYLENLVIKYPGRSAMMCLDKAVSRFLRRIVSRFHDRIASRCPGRIAIKYLGNSVIKSRDRISLIYAQCLQEMSFQLVGIDQIEMLIDFHHLLE